MRIKRSVVQGLILVVACGLIAYGIFINQNELTMEKAIRICLECIGIG